MDSNHEDTTTTDYDSGDSEGVNYAYEGGRAVVNLKQITKAASPKRKTKSRSPKGKPRSAVRCQCLCGASQSPLPSDDEASTEFEEDTDVEGSVEHRCRPTQRRLSGPEGAEAHKEKEKEPRSGSKKASSKRIGRRRTPYIEEYPEDDTHRPVILLKEHKLPRRFSASDAKNAVQNSVEDHQDAGSASRGRSPPGKRRPAWATHQQGRQPSKKHSSSSTKQHRLELQEAPGGKFSGSDMGNSDSEPEQEPAPVKALEPSPPRRHSRESRPAADVASTVTRSSAWPQQPKYSSSWPLQSGQHYPVSQPRRDHGYESEDESDEAPEHSQGNHQQDHQHQHHRHQPHPHHQKYHTRQNTDLHSIQATPEHRQPNPERTRRSSHSHHPHPHPQSHSHDYSHPQPQPHPHHQTQPQPQPDYPREPRPRPRPPRPIVARTVVSQRSMATMDQGFRRGGNSPGTSLCEIWRGRPEDWESPYSSSSGDDDEGLTSDLDGERVPVRMQLLEGSPPKREGSVFSRRSRGIGVHAASGFLRRSDAAAQVQMGAWERCASPEGLDDEELEGLSGRRRGVSRARSRWTIMAYGDDHSERHRGPDPEPVPQVMRRWTYDAGLGMQRGRSRSRSRGAPLVFSARKTREFLSPKPRRAARFDFDAWGRERGSRSMVALGLGVA